jgi:hypothetical protein
MQVDQGKLKRTLTCDNISDSDKERIISHYSHSVTDPNKSSESITGYFPGKLPDDIGGGAGSFTCLDTELGSLRIYSERIRGNDDLVKPIRESMAAADLLTDHLIGWLESKSKHERGWNSLKMFCNNELRHDIANLFVYYRQWLVLEEYLEDDHNAKEFLFRAGQYMFERDYFEIDRLPILLRAMDDADKDPKNQDLMNFVRKFISKKMGHAEQDGIPVALDFLLDQESAIASWNSYLESTITYKNMVQNMDPNDEIPEGTEWLIKQIVEKTGFTLCIFGCDKVHVEITLRCETEPYHANGNWKSDRNSMHWDKTWTGEKRYPMLAYAAWSVPEEEFQKRHFGDTLLKGEALGEYCFWHKGLREEERAVWQSFLLSLNPGEKLYSRIATYRFPRHEAVLDEGRKAIVKAIEGKDCEEKAGCTSIYTEPLKCYPGKKRNRSEVAIVLVRDNLYVESIDKDAYYLNSGRTSEYYPRIIALLPGYHEFAVVLRDSRINLQISDRIGCTGREFYRSVPPEKEAIVIHTLQAGKVYMVNQVVRKDRITRTVSIGFAIEGVGVDSQG